MLKQATDDYLEAHQTVYIGQGEPSRLPDKFGLRELWGELRDSLGEQPAKAE